MSKKAKIWLIILSIPAVLIVVAGIALKLYFTSDRLKALVIPEVEEATQRKVTVESIALSLFPTLGVRMKNLKISAPQGEKFDKQEFLSLAELMLDVDVFALLKNRLEIDEITLRQPKLYLEVNKSGVANYAPPKSEQKGPEAAKQPAAPRTQTEAQKEHLPRSTALFLSNFQIDDGEIEYIDKQSDTRIVVTDYDQKMRASISGDDVFMESESSVGGFSYGSLKSFLISSGPIKTHQRLRYNHAQDALWLDSISVAIREIALVLKGDVKDVQSVPTLNLSLKSTRADLAQLLSLLPKEYMKSAEGVLSSGKFQFATTMTGKVSDVEQPRVKGTFSITDGSLRYSGLSKSIANINLSGAFEKPPVENGRSQPGKFALEKFSVTPGTSTMTGRLSVTDFENPTLSASFNGEMNLAEVKEYYPLEHGTDLTGSLKANFSIVGKPKIPSSIKADGKLEFRYVTIKPAASTKPVRNLTGVITFNNQVIDSKQLSMNLGESDMMLAFTMKNYLALVMEEASPVNGEGKPAMTASLSSRQLRTADLMSEETSRTGQVEKTKGAEGKAEQAKSSPQIQAALHPDIDVDANVAIDKLVTEKFEFTNARGSVKIREGVVNLQNFSVNAFQGNIVTKGMLDVRRMDKRPFNLDLNVSGVEAHALLPKFTSFGNNLFGKLSMNTSLKGDLDDTLGLNPKTLNGDGKVQVADGKYLGSPMTVKLADYTGISELREMEFKDWSNAFAIADGRIQIKDLKIMMENTDLLVNGSQGFDGSLDYRLLLRMPESFSNRLKIGGLGGDLINFLKDNEGRIHLNFKVTGTASNPVYALDTEEARQKAKQVLEQKARAEADRLKEEAKKKVEETLKKLFKKP